MPYVYDPLLDEKTQQPGQGSQPAPMTGGGSTFAGGSGPTVANDQQQKGVNKQGSGFVGLDQYLAANKGTQFGNQVTGRVSGDVSQAKQNLNQGAEDFTNASNAGTTQWNKVGDEFKGIVDNAGKDTTADQTARAKQIEGAQYTGPQAFYGTDAANKAVGGISKAQQEAQALNSEGGRFALLDQYFGRPNYSTGQKTLDNALVANQPGVAAKSHALTNQANQLSEQANQTGQQLENLATANKQATADTAKNASDYATTALTNFGTDLDKRYADFNAGNDAYNQAIRNSVSDLSKQTASSDANVDPYAVLGLTQNQNLYGLKDFSQYLQDATQPTESQFASPEDAARYEALGQIASDNFQLPIDATQAGTGGNGHVTADKGGVTQAINARQAQAKTQEGSVLQQGIGLLNSSDIAAITDPQQRTAAVMNRLNPVLDDFARTYGYRPQITPEMLWQGNVDFNNNQPVGSPGNVRQV